MSACRRKPEENLDGKSVLFELVLEIGNRPDQFAISTHGSPITHTILFGLRFVVPPQSEQSV